MKFKTVAGLVLAGILVPATMAVLGGCSDNSRLRMYITGITVDSDQYGDLELCSTQVEVASVGVAIEQPGTVGPYLDAFVTGYSIEYFYYDPRDGVLKGPVSWLTVDTASIHSSYSPIEVPIGTHALKAWAIGNSCGGKPGFDGGVVQRMTARVTVRAEDTTGKKMYADGSITLYLNNALATTTGNTCAGGLTLPDYWRYRCP